MKLLTVFLLVSSVVVQATHFGWIQTSITCPSGWTPINNRCFLYVHIPKTWADAEKHCQSIGANLASIHNADENNRVQNLIAAAGQGSTHVWIGGSDAQQEKTWLWSDGSRMRYTNWWPGQPDNLKNNQNCLLMIWSDGKYWDDYMCDYRLPLVCAKKG